MERMMVMNKIYVQLADGYEKVAKAYRELAKQGKEEMAKLEQAVVEAETVVTEVNVTIEMVRAALAQKSQEGKTRDVKALLMKYDAGKLSGVNPKYYAALLAEAEVL